MRSPTSLKCRPPPHLNALALHNRAAELPRWLACQGCGASHNTGSNLGRTRRHFRATLAEAGGSRQGALRSATARARLTARDLRRRLSRSKRGRVYTSAANPRYYARSQIAEMHAKVLFRAVALHNRALRIMRILRFFALCAIRAGTDW